MKNEQLIQDLKAARELISDPARWTTGSYARTINGKHTATDSADAVCWCASGAIWHCADEEPVRVNRAHDALGKATRDLYGRSVVGANDWNDHKAIIAAFDYAIREAENGN